MNSGMRYIVASRQGLYIVDHLQYRQVAEGYFFGVTVQGEDLYCFKTVALSDAEDAPRSGSIVRYRLQGGELVGPDILVTELDHNCHQVDFFHGEFYVVDTSNQRVLKYDRDWRLVDSPQILPAAVLNSPDYAHINSILGVEDSIYLMLHNFRRSRPSEIVEFDREFRELRRVTLPSASCHDIVRLEDGSLLYCDSMNGLIASDDGATVKIDELFTRGLAVGADEIAVGSSMFGGRFGRSLLPGFITFLDRDYRRTGRLYLPAAPTQIRRLDGADLSLSRPR